jgi:hypothetical protein
VQVLDHLVGDPVGLLGLRDDLRRDVGQADLSGDDGTALAAQDDLEPDYEVDLKGWRPPPATSTAVRYTASAACSKPSTTC